MKQCKEFYIVSVLAIIAGSLSIYCATNKDLLGGLLNLFSFAFIVWCLKTLHSSSRSGGGWVAPIKSALNMRMDHQQKMILSQHSNQMKHNDLTGARLANLEHKYNEMKAEREEEKKLYAAMMERYDVKKELVKLVEERERLRDGI